MICVYPVDCTDFSGNGLGAVTPMSCTVTETLNGEWELTLVHDIDERGKWTRLSEGCILRAPVPAAMTPSVGLVTQQYQTSTYDVQIYKITTKSGPLHLRSGTGTNYKILGKYKKGREVIVLNKTTSSWYEVTAPDGKHGYMASQYLTFQRTETQTVQINVGFRNQVIEARQLRDQPFRIYRVVPELDKVTVYARHIFYDLLDNMVKSLKPSPSAVGASVVQNLSGACLSSHDFSFYSDLTSTAEDVEWENVNPVEAMLGEDGLVSKYGAELARDWYDVFLVRRVGNNTDVSIREKKNLTGISYDVDETDVVTRIMPTGEDADGNILYLPELYIDSPNLNAYTHPKWIHLPISEAKEVTDVDEPKSKTQCYAEMRKAAQDEYAKGCDLPTITLKVDFVNCSDAEEYKQYAALTDIFLGDSVRVIARRIGVEVSMRMTQYTYDCLTKKYTSVTLGTVADALEGSMISARQLASGSITGAKLALNSVGSGQLQSGSVGSLQIKNAAIGSAHIQDASITRAHIAEALIDVLNVNALNAVTAKIKELAAGAITADELYTSIAMIATAQITTANIVNANIDWAQIESLAADIATISRAQITTANINEANIDWAVITTLSAAVASMVKADIGTADIDWAHIKDLTTDTAIITQGTAGELYIAKLAVTEANMVSLTVGELVVKGKDGHFYSVSVDESGNVVSTLKQVSNDDVADLSINGGEKIIEGSITAQTLNVQNIFGDNAVIRSLIAANLDVDTLFARESTINALNAMDITSNTYLRLMVAGKADKDDMNALDERVSAAELKLTEDAIVSTVRGSEQYQQDQADLLAQITQSDQIVVASAAPGNPAQNALWLDTSVQPNELKRWNGAAWESCGADVDLSAFYTKAEMDTRFEQTSTAIALKADATTVGALEQRVEAAEQKVTPQAITSAVTSSALYAYEKYAGRNYCLNSGNAHTFVDNRYRNPNGTMTNYTGWNMSVSEDLFAHSGNGANIRISFDIKRTNVNTSASSTANVYTGIWVYYRYLDTDGTTVKTTGRGWYLRSTDASFVATDGDWVRMQYGPLSLTSYHPTSIAYFTLGTGGSNGVTGTVQFRNIKLEVLDSWTAWSAAPEDLYGMVSRMVNAESRITQNANNIALKVSTSTYNTEKVYRGSTAPTTLYTNMLWLDTSAAPNLLKRYTGSAWVAAGAQEVKSSGIYIGPNNVAITTENFLLQLLDPANNENVLMEMSANGNVGFKQLYADEVVSDSVASAYGGPIALHVNTSYSGASDAYFRSLGDAVKAVNNRFLRSDVYIYLPNGTGEIYEPAGTQIQGVSGPGKLIIYGYANSRLNSYISVKGCSAHICFQNVSLREIRTLNGSNRNPYLIELQMNHHVEMNSCTLDANNVTYDSVYCRTTHVNLYNCGLYNALQGLEVYMGWAYMQNCKGSCSWSMVSYAGYIICSGSVPSGSRNRGNNGQIYDTGVTIDYGTAIPVVTPDNTALLYATTTKSYRGGWRSDTLDVIQGVYSDSGYKSSLNWNYGCMWFGNLRSMLSGTTIKSATLTLNRKTGSGSGSAKTLYLCAITNASPSGYPAIAANYGAIGTIGRGETATFSVPVSAIQNLASGAYGALCLYESPYNFGSSTYSSGYMRMSGTDTNNPPYLRVVYNGGSGVG